MRMIRVGIGGWTFEPWRGAFFPADLPKSQELAYASRKLSIIEVNGTFYRTQTPSTFAKWAREAPEGFTFALKAPRGATHRNDLTESAPSVERFLGSGITELGDKLGPILWQFSTTHRFNADVFARFADMLPTGRDGAPLRHVIEVAHASYRDPAFLRILRDRNLALAVIDDEGALDIADVTADFVYARLKRGVDEEPRCYPDSDRALWAARVKQWAAGGFPNDLPRLEPEVGTGSAPRDCYVFFISGGKVRAPAAAQAFQQGLAD
jgi:uncharacterized protein YecE (DUF72 family)